MARTDTLGHFLTDVANAIKDKKGTTEPINASDFDTEIQNLPSGGSLTKSSVEEHVNAFLKRGTEYESLSSDNITLYTPDSACLFYGICKRPGGTYKAFWTNGHIYLRSTAAFYSGYIIIGGSTNDANLYSNSTASIYFKTGGQIYHSAQYSTIEEAINHLKSNTSTYSQTSGSVGYQEDSPNIIPLSNNLIYNEVTGELLQSQRISSNETIEVIS